MSRAPARHLGFATARKRRCNCLDQPPAAVVIFINCWGKRWVLSALVGTEYRRGPGIPMTDRMKNRRLKLATGK